MNLSSPFSNTNQMSRQRVTWLRSEPTSIATLLLLGTFLFYFTLEDSSREKPGLDQNISETRINYCKSRYKRKD